MPTLDGILPTLVLVLGFGFIIFVHELGHFLAAKAVGIRVTQFAICFGHAIVTWRKGLGFRHGSTEGEFMERIRAELRRQGKWEEGRPDPDPATMDRVAAELGLGETEYRINWLPLGGYVKMLGQDDLDPTAISEDPRAFNRKPAWGRACVISAGVIMNLIFGVVFFVVAFMAGVDFPPAVVGRVYPNAAAVKAVCVQHPDDPAYRGLRPGDEIVAINDVPVTDMMEVAINTALSEPGRTMRVRVIRPGVDKPLDYQLVPQVGHLEPKLLSIGVSSPMSLEVSPALKPDQVPGLLADAGVKPGMVVTEINGKPVQRFDELESAVTGAEGVPVKVVFRDPQGGRTAEVMMRAEPQLALGEHDIVAHVIGMAPATRVLEVLPGQPAAEGGVQPGDLLARIGDLVWPAVEQVRDVVAPRGPGAYAARPLAIEVYRDGQVVRLDPITPRDSMLGIAMVPAVDDPIVATVLPHHPAADLHLPGGSRIISVDEHAVTGFADLQRWLSYLARRAVERRQDSTTVSITAELAVKGAPQVTRQIRLGEDDLKRLAEATWTLPSALGPDGYRAFDMLRIRVKAQNPITAMRLGIHKTHQFMVQTYITIARLFQGSVGVHHLRGPVGIISEGRRIAEHSWAYLCFFFGLISVNLVVINFLPIPIVDGGLMVMLLIEKLKGSPVSPQVQTAATLVGLVLIGGIFLVTFYYDMLRELQSSGLF